MKVFLSWSGDLSHRVACVLRDWLPSVIQAVRPYVSSEDIDKGARWSSDIAHELEEAKFGIICVTHENLFAPWVHFEAGALSKTIDSTFVSPFLIGVKRAEVQGPLLQFQSTVYEKEDVSKLITSINSRLSDSDRLTQSQLAKTFDVWWPELQSQLDGLTVRTPMVSDKEALDTGLEGRILEELLELVRSQQKLLRSPEEFLPREYLREIHAELGSLGKLREGFGWGLRIIYRNFVDIGYRFEKARMRNPHGLCEIPHLDTLLDESLDTIMLMAALDPELQLRIDSATTPRGSSV